jgi:hypothetical protein
MYYGSKCEEVSMIVITKIIFSNATIKTMPIFMETMFISIVVNNLNHVTYFPLYKEGKYYHYFPSRNKGPTKHVPMMKSATTIRGNNGSSLKHMHPLGQGNSLSQGGNGLPRRDYGLLRSLFGIIS